MLWLWLVTLALGGPVEDAEQALARHSRGRDTAPLAARAEALEAGLAGGEIESDGASVELLVRVWLTVAQDGADARRLEALEHAVTAAEGLAEQGGSADLGTSTSGIAMLVTDGCRRAKTPEEREVWRVLGLRVVALSPTILHRPPATVRGQLEQAVAQLELAHDPVHAGELATSAANLGHPSRSLDLRISEELVRTASPKVAGTFLRQAIGRWPSTWELRDLAGGLFAANRQYEEAIKHLDVAIEYVHPELTRQRAILLRKRAAARTELGDLDGAISDFEAAEPLERAGPTERYQWARTHVLAAQRLTAELRERTGNRAALPSAARDHCDKAIPHLTLVEKDPRLGGPAGQALALCNQVVAAEATD